MRIDRKIKSGRLDCCSRNADTRVAETFRTAGRMANIRDVARRAGVSIATVSATLNKSASVSEETQRRVWAAVEGGRLFAERRRAQPAPRQEPADRPGRSPTSPIRSAHRWCARWRTRRSRRATRSSCATPTTTPSASSPMLAQLRAQHVAGIVLMPVGRGADYVKLLGAHSLPPIVTVDNKVPGLARDFLGVDNRAATRMLTAISASARPSADRHDHRHGRHVDGGGAARRLRRDHGGRRRSRSIPACALPATIAATPPTRRPSR